MQPAAKHRPCGLLLILLLGLAGCSSEPPAPPPEIPKVGVKQPEKRELTDQEIFNGWLDGNERVEVRSRVRGHIHKVHFTDGQVVEKNQLLFELDPRPFEADLEVAKGKLKVFEAQKVAAEKDEVRLRELEKKGGASRAQVEKAEADVKSLEAQILGCKNEVERARLDLEEYSKIRAKIPGRVGKALLTEGNLVGAGGGDPLMTTIVQEDPIRIYFSIDERSLQRYAKNRGVQGKSMKELLANLKNLKATFGFALDGEKTFGREGILAFADNRIDPTTGTLMFYGTADNKAGDLTPGARVRVSLPIGKPYPALLVPETAILADQDKRYVLIVDDKNTVRRRNVALGKLEADGMRAIQPADKLAEGEKPESWRVIVDNLQRARLNYPVEPQ
jgi:RND family efflux transporter MFP subunit